MGYVAKLTRGRDTLDLSSGRYSLGMDYKPGSSSFSVKISGANSAEVRRAVDDLNLFLGYAGDPANPTRFWWNPDANVSATPVWGQRERSVEVLDGGVEYWDAYFQAEVRSTTAFVRLSMSFGSVVEGAKQLAATATGGIVEDWIGVADGQSRGLQIPEADATNGNKMTNPVFGHPTWNTGWTAGAGVTAAKNNDPNFVTYGLNSALIYTSGTAGDTYTQSINAGTAAAHALSCYAKLPDSGTVTSGYISLYCGSALTTTYTAQGNGWYKLSGSVTGGTAAVDTGVYIEAARAIYIDAFQFEQRAYPTAFFYGDLPGCAWAGTTHASKSTRTAGKVFVPTANNINVGGGAVRLVWEAPRNSTGYSGNSYLLDDGDTLYIYYDGANQRWSVKWGISLTAFTTNDTFSKGDKIVFHFTWNGNGLYKNGALLSGGFFAPMIPAANIYIGSTSAGAGQIGGTFRDWKFFDRSLSAAEVLADYNNVMQVTADGQGLGGIPYTWTKDGDNTVDNVDSGASENIAIIGGVPGDLPAKVDAKLTVGGMAAADLYIGRLDWKYDEYIDPEFLTYATPGTISVALADAGVGTIPIDDDEFRLIEGRKLSVMLRAIEGTAAGLNNISLRTGINPGGAYYYTGYGASTWGTAGTTTIDSSPEVYFVQDEEFYRTLGITRAGTVFVGAKRTSGTANLIVHSVGILPSPTTRFTNLSAGTAIPVILYTNEKAYEATGSSLSYGYQVTGAPLEVMPNRYNVLVSYLGREGVTSAATNTLAYSSVYITPRWRLA